MTHATLKSRDMRLTQNFDAGPAGSSGLATQAAEGATSQRISFKALHFTPRPGGQFFVGLSLASKDGHLYVGTAEGPEAGQLECAARAAICALQSVAGHRVGFQLYRVSKVGEFDTVLAHVSVSRPAGDHAQLLCGSCSVNGRPLNAAVKAVLKATNRLFETDFMHRQ